MRRLFLPLIAAALFCSAPAGAGAADAPAAAPPSAQSDTSRFDWEQTGRWARHYTIHWGDALIGDMVNFLAKEKGRYRAFSRAWSRGFAWLVMNFRTTGITEGELGPNCNLEPLFYERRYEERWGKGGAMVDFHGPDVPATSLAIDGFEGAPKSEEGAPKVPLNLRLGVVDPQTAMMEITKITRRARIGRQGYIALKVFDGEQVYHLTGKVGERTTIQHRDQPRDVRPIQLTVGAIAGFSDLHKQQWDGAKVQVFMSDDAAAIPLKIVLEPTHGPFTLTLASECGALEACKALLNE